MTDIANLIDRLKESAALGGKSPTPLYKRLEKAIRTAIQDEHVQVDDALPSERDLANMLGVSRVTVRKAVQALVEDGLLEQRRGAGTFVTTRLTQPLSRLTSFTEDITSRGLSATVRWLDRSTGVASPEEVLALDLSPGTRVARLFRVRNADGTAMCLEHATLPLEMLPDPQAVETSLYAALEARGLKPVRALQRIRARLFEPETAHLLDVPVGSECLYMERRSFLANGRPIEFVRSHYRGDVYDFVAELEL